MSDIIFKYPLDLALDGIYNPNNKVKDEEHTIGNTRARLFAADYGPFYGTTVAMRDAVTGYELKDGDYRLLHPYREARERTGQAVYAAVQILNADVGPKILFTAQMVGGEFSFSTYAIKQAITELLADDRPIYYGDLVGIPSQFVPAPHLHSAYDLYGMKAIVEATYDVAAAVREGDLASRQLLLQQVGSKFDAIDQFCMGISDQFRIAANELALL
jgi:hypothetical protein